MSTYARIDPPLDPPTPRPDPVPDPIPEPDPDPNPVPDPDPPAPPGFGPREPAIQRVRAVGREWSGPARPPVAT